MKQLSEGGGEKDRERGWGVGVGGGSGEVHSVSDMFFSPAVSIPHLSVVLIWHQLSASLPTARTDQ